MNEAYVIFDFSWRFLMFLLMLVFVIYVILHCMNYYMQNTKKYLLKYIVKELTSAINSIFYALLVAIFLLYVSFTSTYVSKIAQDNNITNSADKFKYIIKLGLEKK